MTLLKLNGIPGFADLPASTLAAGKTALGFHLARVADNAAFGVVRLEVFSGVYKHDDEVPVPVSQVDGYTYRRDELMYVWGLTSTGDPGSGWASYRAPWTFWYGVWRVDQATGKVFCQEGYRGNADHSDRQAQTNDGQLIVFTVAQRQRAVLTMAAVPSFHALPSTDFYADRALNTGLAAGLSENAKFGAVNTEVLYLGEYGDGAAVPAPVSPVDGHAYASTEVGHLCCWRWTADESGGSPVTPTIGEGQIHDWHAHVAYAAGVYTATVKANYGSGDVGKGKVAVFAVCQRAPATGIAEAVTDFTDVPQATFMPGNTLRASAVKAVNNNVNRAAVTPELFGPTQYSNGGAVALPVSLVDGYAYSRDELLYVWTVYDTGPAASSSGRMSMFVGGVDSLGNVRVDDWRLEAGAASEHLYHEGKLNVLTFARRKEVHSNPGAPPVFPPTDSAGDDPSGTRLLLAEILDTPAGALTGDTADTVVSFTPAFADASYSVSINYYGSNERLTVIAKTASSFTVRMFNMYDELADSDTADFELTHA